MNLAWLTDIHLNFLDEEAREQFYRELANTHCDALLISGDIAEAPSVEDMLIEMVNQFKKPIYFVLGNHDYYRGKVSEVHDAMRTLTKTQKKLYWLPASGIQQLDRNTILLGQDGWSDGRLGDYQHSRVSLRDSTMIADLFQQKILGKIPLLEKMQELADADARALKQDLLEALQKAPKKIIVLTHVPPFKEICLYEGKVSSDDFLPFFGSKVMGDLLMQIAKDNPSITFLVLCGHTHSKAQCQPLDNLIVHVGKAEYGQPEIQNLVTT
jgi:predicted MPP superfamily phosphohydrolase